MSLRINPRRQARGLILYLDDTVQDLKLSFRTMARNPGFSTVAIATLALGIGLNTAVFTLFDAFSLRPMPVQDPHQIVNVYSGTRENPFGNPYSFPDYLAIREANQVFSGLMAHGLFTAHLSADGFTERLGGALVSANTPDVLGIEPVIGRSFLPEEGQVPGRHAVAMISTRLWRDRFQSSQDAVGKFLKINGHPFTLVGILPDHFMGTSLTLSDVWVPLMMQPQVEPRNRLDTHRAYWLSVVGRLRPNTGLDSAHSSLSALMPRLKIDTPEERDRILTLVPEAESRMGPRNQLRSEWIFLSAIAGAVLLIACANIANLLLARARERRQEMAIRLAAGARRGRLIRYLLTETIVLFLAGGAVAILVAIWCIEVLDQMPLFGDLRVGRLVNLGLDGRMLGFTLILSLTTAILFGLVPAARSSRVELFPELKANEPYARVRRVRSPHLLVILQVTVSFMLLVGAVLSIRSTRNLLALDPGFDPANVGTLSIELEPQGYDSDRGALFVNQLLQNTETLPGVEAATLAQNAPASFGGSTYSMKTSSNENIQADINAVGPRYFETLRIPLIGGRDFRWTDDKDSQAVAVINQAAAKQFWPDTDPIGERISFQRRSWEVIGVAPEIQCHHPGEDSHPYVYFPLLQKYEGRFTLMARGREPEGATVSSMREAVREIDPDLPTFGPPSLTATLALQTAWARFMNDLLSAFGFLALTLASVGLYGVLSRSVVQRTREIAVRLAMGARRRHTVWLILKRALILIGVGLSIGAAGALAVTRLMAAALYQVSPADPVTYLVCVLVVLAASLLACWVPAHRITRLEPMEALRHE